MFKPLLQRFARALKSRNSGQVVLTVQPFSELEPLEQRMLLSTTVFLDFGTGVGVGNTISIDAEDFRDIFGSNTGTNLGDDSMGNANPFLDEDQLDFTPLAYDFDFDGDTDNTDLNLLAAATVAHVQRALEPFDIDIVLAATTDFTDPVTSVGNNAGDADGEFDSYVFMMSVTRNSDGAGVGTGLRGAAAIADLANAHAGNTVDEAVITFIDNVLFNLTNDPIANNQSAFATGTAGFNDDFAQAIAYTSIHEVYHTFSIRHTPDENSTNPQASANQRLLASGDVIRRGSRTRLDPFMVTRYDLLRGTAVTENNNYLFTANDSDIGLRDSDGDGTPDLAYATGTGANDIVTFTDDGSGDVDVAVNPYSDQARTNLIGAGETYNIDLTNDTEGEILVDAGVNADQVVIDATINADFRVRGGQGFDGAADQDLITLNSGGLSGTFTPDADGINGTVVYASGATIDFSEFEDADADNVSIDTVNLTLSSGTVVDEGESFTLTVDFINIDTLDNHTVTVNWGNGDTDMVTLNPGDRDAVFNYTYADDHPMTGTPSDGFTISVSVTDDDGDTGAANSGIVVNDVAPTLTLNPVTMINENGVATLTGTISDPGTLDTFTLDIDWGDPLSPNNTEIYTFAASATGSQTFTLTHQYLDDNPTATSQDTYTISATVTDDDTLSGSDTTTVLVKNVAPVVLLDAVAMINENGVATLTGTISDPGTLDTFTLDIDWGDPLSPNNTETYTFAASATGTQTFTLTHQYLDDNPTGTSQDTYTISATVTDDDTLSGSDTTTVLVKDVAPVVLLAAVAMINENGVATLTGTISDPGTLDTFTLDIDWGDPLSPNNTETYTFAASETGSQTFTFTHQYLDDNPSGTSQDTYTISATVTDDDTLSGSDTTTVLVKDVAPVVLLDAVAMINENGVATLTGTISDPGTLDTFTLDIDWGDPLSPNNTETYTFAASATGTQTFTLTHQYLDDNPTATSQDTYTISVTVTDDDTLSDGDTTTVLVKNVDPVISSFASDATFEDKAEEGEPVNIFGEFTDIGTLDTHTAVVDWGDGSALETVTVIQGAGSGTIEGSHAYTSGGIYTITVTLTDDDTGAVQQTTTAVVTGVGLNLGVLYIIGSAEDDMVMVEETGNGQTMVHASVIPENFRTFATADIDRIISYLCEGEDHLTIANGVTTPAIVHGGDDDDHLHSGGGLTALLGDGGDDVIIGQGGRNLLIGGTGIDDLVGGNKQDILIGGSTTDDSDDDALMAALMTWASGDDYETRAAAIIAMLTAIDDNDSDRLVGAAGLDLFFDGTDDRILGENKFEILN